MDARFTEYFIYFTDLNDVEHADDRKGYVNNHHGNQTDLLALELEKSRFFKCNGDYYPFYGVKSFCFKEYSSTFDSDNFIAYLKNF